MTTPVIVDTDPGNDDAVLLALLAASPAFDLVGVTTVAGNVGVEHTTRNARAVLDWFGRTDVPVARGAAAPLVRGLETADHVHGDAGLHAAPPDPTTPVVDGAGATAIVERARARPGEVTLLAVGPLTNVALALALEPDLPDLLADCVVMGGAAFVPGNASPAAEFNFHVDPEAARRVVRDLHPTVVGLDVTERATVPPATVRELASRGEPFRTVASWLAYRPPSALEDPGLEPAPVHDACVGVHLLGDAIAVAPFSAEVETCGACRGAFVCGDPDEDGAPATADVAVDVDVEAFRETLLAALDGLA
ncbi:MAG: nucleoside hydrolase [Halobacteriaceae archaeon]